LEKEKEKGNTKPLCRNHSETKLNSSLSRSLYSIYLKHKNYQVDGIPKKKKKKKAFHGKSGE
jgi:hypothetical protein